MATDAQIAALYQDRLTFGRRFQDPNPVTASNHASWLQQQILASSTDTQEVNTVLAVQPMQGFGVSPTFFIKPQTYRLTNPQIQTMLNQHLSDTTYTGAFPSAVVTEMQIVWMVRAVYSTNQFFERMVDFWNDHFSVSLFEKDNVTYVKRFFPSLDQIVRTHAFGNFGAMLLATAQNPVMQEYLDLATSSAPQPNENYSREVMELHTLGIASYLGPTTPAGKAGTGYSDADVTAAAAVLSGFSYDPNGLFQFRTRAHLATAGNVLGQSFSGAGVNAGTQFLAYLANHPNTATFVCSKLYLRFVADTIPANSPLLAAMVKAFTTNRNSPRQIAIVVYTLATHPEFLATGGTKFKTPKHVAASVLRATGAEFALDHGMIPGAVIKMNATQIFDFPAPAGPPTAASAYINSSAMLQRWGIGEWMLAPTSALVNRTTWPNGGEREDAIDLALIDPATGQDDTSVASVSLRLVQTILGPNASASSLSAIATYAASSEGPTAAQLAKPDVNLRAALVRVANAAMAMPEFQAC